MAESKKTEELPWYVKDDEGKVFGPIDRETLVEWVAQSRVEPSFSVSRDQRTWKLAPRVPELGMVWIVEASPGALYGPFNRRLVDSLIAAGTVTKEARLYRLDDAGAKIAPQGPTVAGLEAELKVARQAVADMEKRAHDHAETTRKTISYLETKLAETTASVQRAGENVKMANDRVAAADKESNRLREQIAAAGNEACRLRERAEAAENRAENAETRAAEAIAGQKAAEGKLAVAETSLADLRSQLDTVMRCKPAPAAPEKPKNGKSDAIVPEVVVPEVVSPVAPPKAPLRMPGGPGNGGLAALEAAARRELAAAKKQGLGFKNIFGGGK